MSWKETLRPVVARIPSVKQPEGHLSIREKLLWTGVVLVVYFYLTNVLLFGLAPNGAGGDPFGQFRSILAGGSGTILQLGIGPIVTASIVLQLLDGAGLLGLDTQNNPRDQALYQGLQKLLVLVMVFLTGLPIAFSFLPPSPEVARQFGLSLAGVNLLLFFQIAIGGIIILYLDEVVSKWGIGSGVGLFIVAGVSQSLIGGLFLNIIPTWFSFLTGQTPINPFTQGGFQTLVFGSGSLLAILTTVVIFAFVVYAESTKIEIPIQNARVSGSGGKYPLKLIYASVLPLILVRALQANVQFIGRLMYNSLGASGMPSWLGQYTESQSGQLVVDGGLFYMLAPIQTPEQWMWWTASTTQDPVLIIGRVLVDLLFMVVGGAVFAVYWVRTTGMGPEDVAGKIQSGGLQIPGFRRNPKMMERVLKRYIPYVTVIGGVIVGVLALTANMLGTIGGVTGTGLLLMVSITYKIYQELAEEIMKDMYPRLRELF